MTKRKKPHSFFGAKVDLKTYHPMDPKFPKKRITYPVAESGKAIGEHHHRAKLSDADVELIRDIYDEGMVSYATLAKVFQVSKATIYDIVTFRRRATSPAGYKNTEEGKRRPVPRSRLEELGIDPNTMELEDDWDDNH